MDVVKIQNGNVSDCGFTNSFKRGGAERSVHGMLTQS